MGTVEDRVKAVIVEELGVEPSRVTLEARLSDELVFDSLDAVELMMALEEEFGIAIPEEDTQGMTRVKDIVDFIEKAQ